VSSSGVAVGEAAATVSEVALDTTAEATTLVANVVGTAELVTAAELTTAALLVATDPAAALVAIAPLPPLHNVGPGIV
jgi:hypothetical protein